ncbi:MAG: hypothetical protein IPL79_02950 [Myxococcales bacterium]|nr:hypothetical protein [Myxococcales bacterium]
MGAIKRAAPRFDRLMVLRAYAGFIDALVTALVAAPLQWIFFAVDELSLYWLTHAVLHLAMHREFEGTLGMKLLGLVALQGRERPPSRTMAARFLFAYAPAILGFWLAARYPAATWSSLVSPVLVCLPIAEWARATLRLDGWPSHAVLWDRLSGVKVMHV